MPRSGGKKPSFAGQYNRHLEEMRSLLRTLDPGLAAEDEGSLNAAMDIYETDQHLVLEFDLPGISPENISLVQRGMVCVIQADKLSDTPDEPVRYLCLERHFGRLRRTVRLPDLVDPGHIRAEYQCGVLRIICLKGQEHRILIKELTREQV
ncbi:MAG: Hsp20/alpha crystallin family protein [Trichlorobacter sp.]|uniref:Hsp20/alpha crystallin family protein n=1 Tax=Trichlorobacter sp. TaxID=2911007 RepID=UPI0025668A31|nr:Hsp20/alpha crystallin family protein [Trichlorobacter sp.]MDK9717838.1 Hsp20/alpha crystallin family protein [Trichlorobacter sp.]